MYCRWMVSLLEDNTITKLPAETNDWLIQDHPSSMYPIEWTDFGFSKWELKRCPWWLDYPKGQRHPSEEDLYVLYQSASKGKSVQPPPAEGSASKRQKIVDPVRERRSKKRLEMKDILGTSVQYSEDAPIFNAAQAQEDEAETSAGIMFSCCYNSMHDKFTYF